jgi:hypothetical protein
MSGSDRIDWTTVGNDPRPVLVIPVFHGGERFERCLRSLVCAPTYFAAVVLSINGQPDSPDLQVARAFQRDAGLPVAVFNTTVEMNSMDHIRFWATELGRRNLPPTTHLMWLGHDDELDPEGLAAACPAGQWPLRPDTMILGPWKLRHEAVDTLYAAPENEQLETWTCFPDQAATPQASIDWVCDQLLHPTYLNLTGGVFPFNSLLNIAGFRIRKTAGMRMEMTLATAPGSRFITELTEPAVIVYGRADSDRATIPTAHARSDDRHLLIWLARYAARTPRTRARFASTLARLIALRTQVALGRATLPAEDWVVRP